MFNRIRKSFANANSSSKEASSRRRVIVEPLPPRILLSADLPGLDLLVNQQDSNNADNDTDRLLERLSSAIIDEQALTATAEELVSEIVFIDSRITDYQQLLDDLQSTQNQRESVDFTVVLFDGGNSGLGEITAKLDGSTNYDAVHLVTHGSAGSISIGNSILTSDTVEDYQSQLAQWSSALTENADILFYGCDVADSEEGQLLLAKIADFTGADVAGSDDLTGQSKLGGNWVFEHRLGEIESKVAFSNEMQDDWEGVLATVAVTTADDENDGGLVINGNDSYGDTYLAADDGGSILGGLTELTVEWQFKSTSVSNGSDTIVNYSVPGESEELMIYRASGGDLTIRVGGNTAVASSFDYTTMHDGDVHSLAFTWDNTSGDWNVYVDGAIADSGTGLATGVTLDSGGDLIFGQQYNGDGTTFTQHRGWQTELHDIRIFNDARTAQEIASSHRSDLPYDESGMVANWKFNDLSVNGITTDSVSGNNLTISKTGHASHVADDPSLTFTVDEHALDGTIVGQVAGVDAEREAQIATLLAADTDLIYSAETDKFYKLGASTADWTTAQSTAGSMLLDGIGGQLASIQSATENEIVFGIVSASGQDTWVGGSDSTVEGEFRWQTGTGDADMFWNGDFTGYNSDNAYVNWLAGQPNDSGGTEDYVLIQYDSGQWTDYNGTSTRNYLVEWDAEPVLDVSQALTYSIQSQMVAGAFAIDADNGQITVADGSLLDFEINATHTINVRTTDVDSNTHDEIFTVSFKDLIESNNAPTDLSSGIELNTDGGNDAYMIADDGGAILGGLSQVSLEAQFSLSDFSTGLSSPVLNYYAGGDELSLLISSTGRIGFEVDGNVTYTTNSVVTELNHNYSVAATWDNTNGDIAIYLDGELVETFTGARAGHTIASGGALVLSQEQDSLNGGFSAAISFEGTLRDVRIWSEVRSDAEIALNYQYKFDTGNLPNGLIANWQMDGFDGSNQVVDVVSGNNLSIGHATGAGFITSTPVEDLHISETAGNGTSVGFVVPSDPDISNDIASDGLFLEAPSPGAYAGYSSGQSFGGWTVDSGNVDLIGTFFEASPLGGNSVDMNGTNAGSISQSLATEAGKQYQVLFSYAGNFVTGPVVKDMRVSAGGETEDFQIVQQSGWATSNMLWEQRSMTFTADDTSTQLSFASMTDGSFSGPVIAGVRVIEIPAAITTILNNDPTLDYDAATGKFYRFVSTITQPLNAIDAATSSTINGVSGQLATVRSAYENDILRDFAIHAGGDVLLGGRDATVEGDWRFLDGNAEGEQFSTGSTAEAGYYTNWRTAQPDGSTGENQLAISTIGEWLDVPDNQFRAYVIEWDASEVLSNFTFSLTDDSAGNFEINSSTGEITVAATSTLDYDATTSLDVTVQVTDAAGNAYSEVMSIAIDNGLDANQTVPGPQFILEGQMLTFNAANGNAVSVSDSLASLDSLMQVSLAVNNGVLTLSQTTNLTFVEGNNGDGAFVINGTESDINAALEGMVFTPNTGFSGEVDLSMKTALAVNLEGHYTFDDGTADDQSNGTTRDGVLTSGATVVSDAERGQVLSLDGTGAFVEINNTFGEPINFTLSAWVNTNATDTSASDVIMLGGNYGLRIANNGEVQGFHQGSGWQYTLSGINVLGTGWRHIAYSVDSTNDVQGIYIDGVLAQETNHTVDAVFGGTRTTIGHNHGPSTTYDFNGLIDDARIHSRALSADEIAALASDSAEVTETVEIKVLDPIVATTTTGGGLSINETGNDVYLLADDGDALLGGLADLSLEFEASVNNSGFPFLVDYAVEGETNEFSVMVGAGSDIRVLIGGNGYTFSSTVDGINYEDGVRRTVGITWDGSTGDLSLYADGKFQQTITGASTGYTLAGGGTLVLGGDQDSVGGDFSTTQMVSGDLYRARLFDNVRSANEMATSYRSELPHDESNMLAQWNFGNLSVDGVVTESVTGNNLTLKRVQQSGFTVDDPSVTLQVTENALDGTLVATVAGNDVEREQQIADLLAADPELSYDAITNKFYRAISTGDTFTAIQATALGETLSGVSGEMVTVGSAHENELVRQMGMAISGGGSGVFLGASDATVEGEWRWQAGNADGDSFWNGTGTGYAVGDSYSNWAGTEPQGGSTDEDYIVMFNHDGGWRDTTPAAVYASIAQWDADEVLDVTQAITYTITSQTNAGAFSIDTSTGQVKVADGSLLDFETDATHTINVRTTDVDTNTYDEAFTVSLNDLIESNNAPTNLSSGIELNTDDGNDAYLQAVNGGAVLGGLTEFAMEVSLASVAPEHPYSGLVTYTSTADGDELYLGYFRSAEEIVFVVQSQEIRFSVPESELFDGAQHHIAVTWGNSNGEYALYIDGELIGSGVGLASGATLETLGGDLILGHDSDYGNDTYSFSPDGGFAGTLYDVRVWNDVRSAAEIALNYQNKFDSGNLPSGLIANWQMDGFNGSNEVVDVVSGNNLSVGHASGVGFIASMPVEDLHINENTKNGATVGFVVPSDPDVYNDIVSDGLFTDAPDPTAVTTYTSGQSIGDWTVAGAADVYLHNADGTYQDETPLGGNVIHLAAGVDSAIEQTLATEAGRQYQVVFAGSGLWNTADVKQLRASADGESADFVYGEAPDNWNFVNSIVWEHGSLTFTASESLTTLRFEDNSGYTGQGILLSDVQVIEIPAAITTILNNDMTLSYDAATDKFYKVVNAIDGYNTALNNANIEKLNGLSGELLTIRSAHENEVVRKLINERGLGDIWLFASDDVSEGTFVWNDDGTTFYDSGAVDGLYQNFASGQPDGSNDRVQMSATTGEWSDVVGNPTLATIIEWDASEVLSNFTFNLTDDASGRFAVDSNSGEITVADGSLLDFETATTHNVDVQVTDAAGNSYVETKPIAVVDGLDLTQTAPGPQTIVEDAVLTFISGTATEVSVTDTLSGTDTDFQVALSVNDGRLNLSGVTGITFVEGASGGSSFVINGTESDINAALNGMTFTPNANYNGAVTLNMFTSLAADLEGHYTFEGGSADDQSAGIAKNGILEGDATTAIDTERGEVLSLDGDGDRVVVTSDFGNPTDVTISAWVNLTTADTNGSDIISFGDNLIIRADRGLGGGTVAYTHDGSYQRIDSNRYIAGQGWTHVAATFNDAADELAFYIDGELMGTYTDTTNVGNVSNVIIGSNGSGAVGYDVNGEIDDARIYSRALSADEIAALATDQADASDSVAITVDTVNDAPSFHAAGVPVFATHDIATNADGAYSLATADVDGDGDLDVLSASSPDDRIVWYENDGSENFTTRTIASDADGAWSVTTADVDGDGDVDVLSASQNDDRIVWYENDGSENFTPRTIASDADGARSVTTADVDGDGDVDVLSASNLDNRIVWYENDGSEGFTAHTIASDANGAREVTTADVDRDGDVDVLSASENDDRIVWYENDGSEGFTTRTIASDADSARSVTTADVDGDGDVDVLSASVNDDRIVWYENDGSEVFTTHTIVSNADGATSVTTADVDGDGDVDVLSSSNYDDRIVWYENDGSEGFTTHTIASDANGARSVTTADVDGDGDLDVLSASYFDDRIVWYENNGGLFNTLDGNPTYTEGGTAVVLDNNVEVFDAELNVADNYNGGFLWLHRAGGGVTEDVFSATGNLAALSHGGNITLSGINIGTVSSMASGNLILTFNNNATQAYVNETLQSIAYENTSNAPDASVDIVWEFYDGNSGAQGSGGQLIATGNTTVTITAVNDAPLINTPELLINGDLASNDLTGWSTTGTVDATTGALRFGAGDIAGPHSASQSFATVVGQTYTLTLQYRDDSASKNQQFAIDVDGNVNLLSNTVTSSTGGTSFFTRNYNFVADSALTTLTFTDISVDGLAVDGFIDNVSVIETAYFNPVTEDDTNNAGQTVASLLSSHSGDLVMDVDGDPEGIAITSHDNSAINGWFDYSLDSGANWTRMGSYTSSDALLLRDTDQVRFVPQGAVAEQASLTFRAWDQTSGTAGDIVNTSANGGSTAFSAQTTTVSIATTDINDAPQFGSPDAGVSMYTASSLDGYGVSDIVLLSDGSQVVVGTDSNDIVLTKFNADGTVDTGFGTDGLVRSGYSADNDSGYAIDVDSSDRLVVVGRLHNGTDYDGIVMRYSADGSLDNTFATAGVYTYASVGDDAFRDVVVLAGDKILVAGENSADALVVRLNADGSLDTTFDTDGIVTFDLESGGTTEEINAIDLQSDGKIIVAGEFSDTLYDSGFVTRLTTTGAIDTTFGATGTVTTTFGLSDDIKGITDVLVQADDKIIIAGAEGDWYHWGMTRFNADGTLDTSFDTDGHLVESFGGNWGDIAGVEQQSDGKLVVAGYMGFEDKGQSDWVLARYELDGSYDSSYGNEGIALPQVGYYWNEIYTTTIAADDTLLVAGYTSHTDSTSVGYFDGAGLLDGAKQSGALDGNPTYIEGGSPVVLDAGVYIFDRDLSEDDYAGTTLTLARNGAASSDDVFSATGTLGALAEGGNLVVDGTTIGTVTTNSGGMLVLSLNSASSQRLVNEAVSQIAYSNTSAAPPLNVQIDWTFDDGNTGAQGSGGPQQAAGSTTVDITPVEGGISVSVNDSGAFGLQAQASQAPTSGDATYLSQAVALNNDGSYVLVWAAASDSDGQGVYSQRYDALGNPLGVETRVNSTITGNQNYASVAMNNAGNYVVVWGGEGSGDTDGVFGQRFDASGAAQGGEFLVNTTTTGSQAWSSVAMDAAGNFVVVWEGEGTLDTAGIFAQRFDAGGSALGGEFLINSTVADLQVYSEVSMDSDGNFTVTWTSLGQDGSSSYGVYVRRFDADGTPITGEIQVDADTAGGQLHSQLDVNDAGGFVIVWRDDGATDTMQAQLFNADGSKNGSEIIVSDLPEDGDNYPAVALSNDGSFVVVWESQADGNDYGIVARPFDASGTPTSGSFVVNSRTEGGQEYPAISINDSGQFVIAFEDWTTATVESRVYGLTTTEAGGTASVDVVLDVAPTADVTIALSMPDATEGSLSTNLLTFTDFNWNTPQTVTITGLNDSLSDGDIRHLLVFDPASSTDLNYDGLDAEDLVVSNLDNNPLVDLDEDDSVGAGVDFSVTYVESAAPVLIVDADAVISDQDSDNLGSLLVTITNLLDGADEVLAADTSGTSIAASYAGGVLTLSGTDTVDNYQQVLRTITYENTATEPDKANRSITFVASDGINTSPIASTSVNIAAVNDAPVNTVPGTQTVAEETQTAITGISVADSDAATGNLSTELQVSSGVLDVTLSGAATISAGANGSNTLTILGSLTDINATLASLLYTGDTNVNGVAADSLSVTTDDGGNTGSGGAQQDIDNIQIDIAAVNDAPSYSASLDGTPTFIEGSTAVVLDSNVDASDPELDLLNTGAGNYNGATLTLVRNGGASSDDVLSFNDGSGIALSSGNLIKNSQIVASFDTTTTAGVLVVTFTSANGETPTSIDIDNILGQITYANSSDIPPTTVQIDWNFNDGNTGAQGSGGAAQVVGNTTVTIQNAADLSINAPANRFVQEDSVLVFSGANVLQVFDGISSFDSPMRVTLSVANGTLSLASITGITFIEGSNGSSTMVIDGLESDLNVALDGFTFTPEANYNGSVTLNMSTELAADLDAQFTFETDGNDQSAGTIHNGNLTDGAAITIDAERGNVLDLTGVDDEVTVSPAITVGNEITLSAWINTTSTGSSQSVLTLNNDVTLKIAADGSVEGNYRSTAGSTFNTTNGTENLLGTGWRHIAYTVDVANNTQQVYVDGVLAGQTTFTENVFANGAGDQVLGRNAFGNSEQYNGLLDEIRIYSRSLSADEIAALATNQTVAIDSVAITVDAVNDAPFVDLDADNSVAAGVDFSTTWTEGTGPVLIADGDATISDIDTTNLTSLTVTLTNLLDDGNEFLAADTTGTSVVASYDSVSGVLTLSGSDTVANYQQVLRTVTYDNTFTHPNETARTITVQANDGTDESNIGTTTVAIVGTVDAGVTITAIGAQGIGEQVTVNELPVYSAATYHTQAVALAADGSSVVVWTSEEGQDGDSASVMARLFDAQGSPVGSEFVVNLTGAGWQDDANIAMDAAGNFVVSWTDWNQDGDSGGVYAQRFDSAGVAQGGEFLVNTTTSGMQANSSVTMASNGDFVIAWEGNGVGDTSGVFAQRFDATGVAQGGEFRINETTTLNQDHVVISSDGAGNVVATWTSRNQDGSGRGVYMHRFDNVGNSLGEEQLVNTSTAGDQWVSSVAMNDNGAFVVTWRNDGLVEGIYMQLYASDGTRIGGETQVHSVENNGFNYPQASIDDAGNVTVVWQDFVDASDYGIVARQFDANGTALGAQFIVNTHEQWLQEYPAVAMNGDGQFAVVFTDYDVIGGGEMSVEMRRFGAATTEAGGTASYSYVLDTQPTDDVTLTLSTPDSTEGALSTNTLTFTSADWNTEQFVTVTGVEDVLADGNVVHQLVASTASSSDVSYNGLTVRDVNVTNLDNDPSLDLDADNSAVAGINYVATWTENGGVVAVTDVDATLIDPDSATLASVTVTLTNVLNGANEVLAADTTGTSIVATYTSGTGVLLLSGSHSVEDYQQVLRTVTYNNASEDPDATGRVITFVASDGINVSPIASTSVNIVTINDAPVNAGSLPTDIPVTEDVLSNVDLSLIDLLDIDVVSGSLTVTLTTASGGNLTAAAGTGITVGGSSTALTLSGTLADLNAYIDTASNIRYLHVTPGINGNDVDTLQINVNDNGNSGSGGGTDIDMGTVNIDIGAVNNAPINTVPGSQSVAEETATAITGISVGDADAGVASVSTRLQVSNGVLTLTPSGDITISAGSNASTDLTLQGSIPEINATLATLRYTGNVDLVGIAADILTVTTNDMGNTGSGGALQDVDTVQINITQINDAPVIIAPTEMLNIMEGQMTVTTVQAIDSDSGDELSYSVANSTDSEFFLIDPVSGVLSFNEAPDYENPGDSGNDGTYEVDVQVVDSGGLTDSQRINIIINNVNESPTSIALNGAPIDENIDSTNGLTIGTLTATDPDAAETFQYSIIEGPDAALFSIEGVNSDQLVLTDGVLDTERQSVYTLAVQVVDTGGLSAVKELRITINNIFEPSSISGDTERWVVEDVDASVNSILSTTGTLVVTDPEGGSTQFNPQTLIGSYGTLSIDASGQWEYNSNNSQQAVQSLGAGETQVETLIVTTESGLSQPVSIVIQGQDDQPVATGEISAKIDIAKPVALKGTITILDPDTSDNPIWLLDQIATISESGYGTFSLLNNQWTYNLDSRHSQLVDMKPGDILNDGFWFSASDGSQHRVDIDIVTSKARAPEFSSALPVDSLPVVISSAAVVTQSTAVVESSESVNTSEHSVESEPAMEPEQEVEPSRENAPKIESAFARAETELLYPEPISVDLDAMVLSSPSGASATTVKVNASEAMDLNQGDGKSVLRQLQFIWDKTEELKELKIQELAKLQLDSNVEQITEKFLTAEESDSKSKALSAQVSAGLGLTIAAGYVTWVLQAGSMIASLLASMPVWWQFDPLPVLANKSSGKVFGVSRDDDEESESVDGKQRSMEKNANELLG